MPDEELVKGREVRVGSQFKGIQFIMLVVGAWWWVSLWLWELRAAAVISVDQNTEGWRRTYGQAINLKFFPPPMTHFLQLDPLP